MSSAPERRPPALDKLDPGTPPLAVIFGLAGLVLGDEEKKFLQDHNPLGVILFQRNIDTPDQVRALIKDVHGAVGRAVPVLIDQEGGRVQRLGPPHWPHYPAANSFQGAFLRDFAKGKDKLKDNIAGLSHDLYDLGITVNCTPVMDVLYPETSEAIGDRAFSQDPSVVATLAGITARTSLETGVIPVMKHLPGQGRAREDSHHDLPHVTTPLDEMRKSDFVPFKDLLTRTYAEAAWGMVAHIVYDDIDDRAPASCSRPMIWDIIRGEIGFKGLLLSDDIGMDALADWGDAAARADRVLRAGCDIALHCNGKLDEMTAVAAKTPVMSPEAVERYNRSAAWMKRNVKL